MGFSPAVDRLVGGRDDDMAKVIRKSTNSRAWDWTWVFALNLIVPLMFGRSFTDQAGRIGMAAAIALLWYLGDRLCTMGEAVARALVIGGLFVALTQPWPFPQVIAGSIALEVAAALGQATLPDSSPPIIGTELGGLVATGLTGVILMGVAGLVGALVCWFIASSSGSGSAAKATLYGGEVDG